MADNENVKKVQMEKLKEYFRDVIAKQDFDYNEYAAKAAEWKALTGEEFQFDVLLSDNLDDSLKADEDVLRNINRVEEIQENNEEYLNSVVEKSKEQVRLEDEEGEEIVGEKKDNLFASLMSIARLEVAARYADNKFFTEMEPQEQEKAVVRDTEVAYHLGMAAAVGTSAAEHEIKSGNATEESVALAGRDAIEAYLSGRYVTANKAQVENAVTDSVIRTEEKTRKLSMKGFIKAARRVKHGLKTFRDWCKKTGIALKDGLIKDLKLNRKQWITNTAVGVGVAGAALISAPAAIVAASGYVLYTAISTPLWTINRKRNELQSKELATGGSGDAWKGKEGLKKAWHAIKEDPREKARFDRQWKIGVGVGVVSGALIGAASAATVPAMEAVSLARFGTGLARVAGANANTVMTYVSDRNNLKKLNAELAALKGSEGENQEVSSENAAKIKELEGKIAQAEQYVKSSKTAAIITGVATTAMEGIAIYGMMHNAAAQSDVPSPEGNTETPDGLSQDVPEGNNIDNGNVQDGGVSGDEMPGNEAPEIVIPEKWDPSMGITEKEWGYIHTVVTPGRVANFEETYMNTANAIQTHPDVFVNPDGTQMTTEQAMWEGSRIIGNSAMARPDGHGGLEFRLWDPDGREVYTNGDHELFYDKAMTKPVPDGVECLPRCWGDEETVKAFQAIYKMINCGEEIDGMNVARVKQFFDETLADGTYTGRGHGIGVTHNYMDRDGCGDVHWRVGRLFRKAVVHHTPKPEPEPVIPEPEPVKPVIPEPEPVKPVIPEPEPVKPVTGPALNTLGKAPVINEGDGTTTVGNGIGSTHYRNVSDQHEFRNSTGATVTYPTKGGRGN